HNEVDEPKFTQPLLYKIIEKHPDPREIYNKKLLDQGSVDASLAKEMEKDFRALLQERLNESKEATAFSEPNPMFSGAWTGLRMAVPEDFNKTYDTAVSEKVFVSIAKKITALPADKKFFR